MKKKLTLILIGIIILTGVFIRNIYLQIKEEIPEKEIPKESVVDKKKEDDIVMLKNVWIISGKGTSITAYVGGIENTYKSKYQLSEEINEVIGDLTLHQGVVTKVSVKPDTIRDKVLVAAEDYIELESYGILQLEEDYKIYKVYSGYEEENKNSILVGYSNVEFVVSGEKICAALIKDEVEAKNIRVLLNTTDYKSIYHESVKLSSTSGFILHYDEKEKTIKAGETLTLKSNSKYLKKGRVQVTNKEETGKIQLLSITRNEGNPYYRGTIEIASTEEGLTLVNELSLEEYLYAVIPSEMPTNYGLEALKVQAVCARSYAYNQLFENSYSKYGAHVDDSVYCQVYNNISENESSIRAVKATYGQLLKYEDKVISAYYFSTSCGATSSAHEVWGSEKELPYLIGNLQLATDKGEKGEADFDAKDLKEESEMRKFLKKKTVDTYDSSYPWYRWTITMKASDIKRSIDSALLKRYEVNPNLIQTLQEDGTYLSVPVDTVGDVVDIQIQKRGTGGIITELILVGSKNTVRVMTEYNIRAILAPNKTNVVRQDKSTIGGLSMLPSAFFVVDKKEKHFIFTGGGYGHGVGMSQNGVKSMVEKGYEYEEILEHYYPGITIEAMPE